MIRLTRQADYGILLLVHIAGEPLGSVHAAPDLATISGVPVPMVSKILKTLARNGLLVSHRGPRGGYGLARASREISLADIVQALDGPIAMTACTGHEPDCGLEASCRVHPHWQRLNQVVINALSNTSLAEMVAPLPAQFVRLQAGDRTLSFPNA